MLRQWSATNWEALPSHEGEQLKKDSQHAWCVGDFDGLQFLLSTVCEEVSSSFLLEGFALKIASATVFNFLNFAIFSPFT